MKAVLIRISTQTVIKKALYPRVDMGEVIGLKPDLKWLLVYNPPAPSYNASTHRLGVTHEITEVNHPDYPIHRYERIYTEIALTQEEQDEYIQRLEDSDNSAIQFLKYKNDGVQGFDRAYALIIRRSNLPTGHANKITGTQAKNLSIGLYDSLEPLYKGLWQLVKLNLSNETPPTNTKLLDIFNKIKTGVDNYVSNNY
jgi:hypothetical protein